MNFFNLFGPKKQKDDPYWEFDKAKHYRPKLNTGDFFRLAGFDFGWFVLEPLSVYIQDRQGELTKGNTLSYGQKALYYWWYVDAQVTNGGFTQFYYNDYGRYAPTAIRALKYIGDNRMAELVNRSYELYLKNNGKIADARSGGPEGFSNLYMEMKDFEELDTEYYSLHEKTMKKLENYIRQRPNEFCLDEEGKEFDLSYTGDLKRFYASGKPREIIPVANGVVSGTYTSHYENGNLKEIIQYLDGEQTGEREEFYENGNKRYSVKALSDQQRSEYISYHENGNPKTLEQKLRSKDERIGEYQEWYDNGQLAKKGTYVSNYERNGEWIEFHKNGNRKLEAKFVAGDFLIYNCWLEDGKQTLTNGTGTYIYDFSGWKGHLDHNEHEYKDFKRHGRQYTYTNGVISLYQEMENGKENGITKSFDESGNVMEETIYENGAVKSKEKSTGL